MREHDTKRAGMLFMLLILGIYPLVFHNYYYDITRTKWLFFTCATLGCAILALFEYAAKLVREQKEEVRTAPEFSIMDFAMMAFVAANLLAFLFAEDKQEAFFGMDSRYQGLFLVLVYAILYIMLTRCYLPSEYYVSLFAGVCFIIYLLGILQHFNVDFIGFYRELSAETSKKFLSTIGNINMFSEYCCITLALFFSWFCCKEMTAWQRIRSAVLLFFGSMALFCANSDSGIVGCGVFFFIAGFFAIRGIRFFLRYLHGLSVVAAGAAWIGYLQKKYVRRGVAFDSLAKAANHPEWFLFAGCLLFVAATVGAVWLGLAKRKKTGNDRAKRIVFTVGGVILLAASATLLLRALFAEISPEHFTAFDDQWGTNRGYIWSRLWSIYQRFPFFRKLFGGGQGSVALYMNRYYADELAKRDIVYDSAHNEYLHALFTTGLVGLLSYLGILVAAFRRYSARGARQPLVLSLLGAMAAYGVQAFFNISQPIVSPFFFIFLAWAEGEYRMYQSKNKKLTVEFINNA